MDIGERVKNVVRGMGSILNPDPLPYWPPADSTDIHVDRFKQESDAAKKEKLKKAKGAFLDFTQPRKKEF